MTATTDSAKPPATGVPDAAGSLPPSLVADLGRIALASLLALYVVRLVLLPDSGVGSRSPLGMVALVLISVLLVLPWRRWMACPGRLLGLTVAGGGWFSLIALVGSWKSGPFIAWGWPLWALSVAALVGALQVYAPQRALRFQVSGGLLLLGLLLSSTLLIWHGPGGTVKEMQWLSRGWLASGGVYLAVTLLWNGLARGVAMARLRERLAFTLLSWAALLIALTSLVHPWIQAHSLHAEAQQGRIAIVLLGGVLLGSVLSSGVRRHLPIGAVALIYLFGAVSTWINGSAVLPALSMYGIFFGLLLSARRWPWVVGLWAVYLAVIAKAPDIEYSPLLMHGMAGTAILGVMLWLNRKAENLLTGAAPTASGTEQHPASPGRGPLYMGIAVGLGALLSGGVGIAWLQWTEQANFQKDATQAAEFQARALFRLLEDYEHIAEVLAAQDPGMLDDAAAFAAEAAEQATVLAPGVSVFPAPKGIVGQGFPPRSEPAAPAPGQDLLSDPRHGTVVRDTVASRRPAWHGPFPESGGGLVLLYPVPYYTPDGVFAGVVATRLNLPQALDPVSINYPHYSFRVALGPTPDALKEAWAGPGWTGRGERLAAVLRLPHPRTATGERGGVHERHTRHGLDGKLDAMVFAPEADADLWIEVRGETLETTPSMALPMRLQVLLSVALLLGWFTMWAGQARERRSALAHREQDFTQVRAMFDKSVVAMYLTNAAGRHVAHNAAARRVFRATEGQLATNNLEHIRHSLGPEFTDATDATMADGEDRSLMLEGTGTHGQWLDLECTLSRLMIAGAPHLMLQAADMSAVHAGQQALERAYTQLQLSLESAGLYTHVADLASMSSQPDRAMHQALGLPPEQLGRPLTLEAFLGYLHPDDRAPYAARVQALIDKGEDRSVTFHAFRMVAANGSVRFFEAHDLLLCDTDGRPESILGVGQEVTERKAAETALISAREAAEAANRAKSDFLANMSHELRTPLNVILGMLGALKERNLSGNNERLIDTACHASEILLAQVNDVLDFSKLSDGELPLNAVPISLAQTFERLHALMQPLAQEKDLGLAFHNETCHATVVLADRQRLEQILTNLLSNAIKFTDRGRVDLIARCLAPQGERVDLRIEVRDTGSGMPAEFLPRLFDRFTQVESSSYSGRRGTGLGMAITKQLIDLMGGRIDVESRLGEGSKFTIQLDLPIASDAERADLLSNETEDETPKADLRGIKVLYAEDNPMNREVMDILLEGTGVNLTMVENGQLAVTRMVERREVFDTVLMDLQMPVMDGIEAATALRIMFSKEELPIIGVSANVFDMQREEASLTGMNDFLPKPLNKADLLRVLSKLTGRHAPLDERTHAAKPSEETTREMLDYQGLLENMGGNRDLANRILNIFVNKTEAILQNLEQGVTAGDAGTARRAMHAFKGNILTIHAHPLLAHLEVMQQHARDGDLDQTVAGLTRLRELLTETVEAARRKLGQQNG
jgi:PAS domain S-box-containing protein